MPRTRVKICCIASSEEADLAAAAGADMLGLVGPMPSGPGVVDLDTARSIMYTSPIWSPSILLTASETAEAVQRDAKAAGVGAVQVVRHISPSESKLLAASPLRYLQVIHVEDQSALDLIDHYAPYCDGFLLDSGRPSEDAFGGTGRAHDWAVSAEFRRRSPRPVFLAGGLTPDNVSEAIHRVRPFGVDVCSSLRPQKALDPHLLDAFMAAVAAASLSGGPDA
ncbi:MAG: phosphoribosylanthranilate isomerase [Rhodobacteraceae bacterium]|nr:phosphoribosylanthranilate isomerase [Paracoccaceae bacterium]